MKTCDFKRTGPQLAQHDVHSEMLREMFPGRLISLRGYVCWPAQSPDLSPGDFFLWKYLKEKDFKRRPQSLEDLKERIRQEIDGIPPELTRRVNFRERVHQYIDNGDRNLSDIMIKTRFFSS